MMVSPKIRVAKASDAFVELAEASGYAVVEAVQVAEWRMCAVSWPARGIKRLCEEILAPISPRIQTGLN